MDKQRRAASTGTTGDDRFISPELDRLVRQRARDLRLRKTDQQRAVRIVNHLIDSLVDFLKNNEDQAFFKEVSVLTSGSYYEMVKINKPNEFDIMLKLKVPRVTLSALEEYDGLFYSVKLYKSTRLNVQHFLLEDGRTISATKIKKEMHRLVRKFLGNYKGEGCWVMHRLQLTSPAITLELKPQNEEEDVLSLDIVPALEVLQGWPQAARAGPDIDRWLGKRCRRNFTSKAVYFVPKGPKAKNLKDEAKESWRISFSHIEKEMIQYHGNKRTCCEGPSNKCCRKLCLRLLKCLIEGLKQRFPKELEPLSSYHGKTAFFHTLSVREQDSFWAPGQLSVCFMKLFGDFERCAQSGTLFHFFVRGHNLFSPPVFPKRTLAFLTNALKEQGESGFPVLREPSPTPALVSDNEPLIDPNSVNDTEGIVACKGYNRYFFMGLCVFCVFVSAVIGCVF
ncbi:cyclic GMP-AMP synthase [Triplophysa rosa]|uniref:cyclic GMP-AMP synthase n=1 Tax=Triplophysa rosa TaxID=992332 RepID=UPI002545F2F4|nr:cyclic GMP-AMP synthase [Triplophysa rosa]XP_057210930.1 cyclic GMP-AMP synthase [Triplophysa rosa]XP_057210931.1 cyclic GMP-AMP synthase [Triplophysa rosa]